MSEYWNSRTKNLSPYTPGEQPRDRQFAKLNTNENPYPPSPKVIEAIRKAAGESLRLYPDPGCGEFREAVAARYGVRPEQVFAGNGSDEVLAFAFGAFFESGENSEKIFFPDITYSFYPVYANLWNIPYRTIPLGGDFSINTAGYKTDCGGVVFPNPNAPTGMAVPLCDILSLAEYLAKQGKVFILDEAYIAFGANSGKSQAAESAVPHIGNHPNLLTVHTLSKSASLAGLRAGFAIGDEKLIEGLCRVRDSFNSYTLDRLALAGAAAAVSDAAYYGEANRRIIATRERVAGALRGLGFTVLPSAANFVFIKAPGAKAPGAEVPCVGGAEFFSALRQRGILVRHFNKERIADYLRVSIGTDEEMDAFLGACREIIS
ncbi:MAG: aminotransferase class I/II-fold pyridoxal phosphate-dependent enzyme [Treponema sp.]|jgi:histidinol-phosphate aminotransferase|nr:aminotransferase class I/II-fold pyridoxal phosphate-dependent enzyme [Treponema sp.]